LTATGLIPMIPLMPPSSNTFHDCPNTFPLRRPLLDFAGVLVVLLLAIAAPAAAQSFYTQRLDDPQAVYLDHEHFGVSGNGLDDDSAGIQKAINQVEETTHRGVVYVPAGRYRLGKTIYVWAGVRLIGYGASRPVFVLGANTPGFQSGDKDYLIWFTAARPKAADPIVDANSDTFFGGIQNIDIEIKDGNPAAVAVRFHVAQLCMLAHMNFRIGTARAAMEDIGNIAYDVHVDGGQYGITTGGTSPGWQFTLMDSSFEHQTKAALHTNKAGMTLIRDRIAHVPVAVDIGKGATEMLYARDLQLEDVKDAAVVPGDTDDIHEQLTLENIACTDVPHFLTPHGANAAAVSAPAKSYVVDHLSFGLEIGADGREGSVALRQVVRPLEQPAPPVPSDIPPLPQMESWVNVRTLGVKGDGVADDADALQAAIKMHRVLFLPLGKYFLSHSLTLQPDTVLLGMNPGATQIGFDDNADHCQGTGPDLAVLNTTSGGTNIVSGIQVCSGRNNPRAIAVLWQAGPASMLEDSQISGSHLRPYPAPPGSKRAVPTPGHSEPPDPSLIVSDGGGGVFRNIWTCTNFARGGLRVENTRTRGRVYELSCEHHFNNEVQFHSVSNWDILALQTEDEPGQGMIASLELQGSHDLTFADLFQYRTSRSIVPALHATVAQNSGNIRFENVGCFCGTRFAFDNTFEEPTDGIQIRTHFFGSFTLGNQIPHVAALPLPAGLFDPRAQLTQVVTGCSNATSLISDSDGNVYFTDAHEKKIYIWSRDTQRALVLWRDAALSPVVLAVAAPSSLLGATLENTVFTVPTKNPVGLQPLTNPGTANASTSLLLPAGGHQGLGSVVELYNSRKLFFAPDSDTAMVTGRDWHVLAQASQLTAFTPNSEHYAASENDGKIYLLKLNGNGQLQPTVFANRAGSCAISDPAGTVFVAAGQVYIYDRHGKQLGVLEVPERPSSLCFGGKEHNILFIGARTSVYAIQVAASELAGGSEAAVRQ
jgi:hypothetical protein